MVLLRSSFKIIAPTARESPILRPPRAQGKPPSCQGKAPWPPPGDRRVRSADPAAAPRRTGKATASDPSLSRTLSWPPATPQGKTPPRLPLAGHPQDPPPRPRLGGPPPWLPTPRPSRPFRESPAGCPPSEPGKPPPRTPPSPATPGPPALSGKAPLAAPPAIGKPAWLPPAPLDWKRKVS